jgi:hypothetical protein
MSTAERRVLAEQRKLEALRERIRETRYLRTREVLDHLQLSRATLYAVPREVLPWAPGPGASRRYHPADVAAYPARARRWKDARERGTEAEVLEEMRAELATRDERLTREALEGDAA